MNLRELIKQDWKGLNSFIDIVIDGETVVKEEYARSGNVALQPYFDLEVEGHTPGEFLIDEVWDVMEEKTIITLAKPEVSTINIFAIAIYKNGKFAGIDRDKIFYSLPKAEEWCFMKNNDRMKKWEDAFRVIELVGEVNAKLA